MMSEWYLALVMAKFTAQCPNISSICYRHTPRSDVLFKKYWWSAFRWTHWAEVGKPAFPSQVKNTECSKNAKFSNLIKQTNLWPYLTTLLNLLAVKKSNCLFRSGVESRVQVRPAFVLHRRGKESAEPIHLTSGKVVMPQGGKNRCSCACSIT